MTDGRPRPEVFISYPRQDGEALARTIRERLGREHPDIRLWQDRAEMEGDRGWWRQITDALDLSFRVSGWGYPVFSASRL